nr:1,4-alpha-glucan branching protein GlgB [Clostridium polynesiense]
MATEKLTKTNKAKDSADKKIKAESVEKATAKGAASKKTEASKKSKAVKAPVQKKQESKTEKTQQKSSAKREPNPVLSDFDIYLFHEGHNYESYNFMGAHYKSEKRKKGVRFTTWAPRAQEIFVVGDFSNWKEVPEYSMEKVNPQGIWSKFIPGINPGELYKYAIKGAGGKIVFKSDPYAFQSELRPNTASIVAEPKKYRWANRKWINKRNKTNVYKSPMNIYELHLGSWKRDAQGGFLNYRDIGRLLADYVKEMGYTHVELMPIMEHPLDTSWGYQITGYYSVTSRFGTAEDFKDMVNTLHKENIGVILDWVPGHFCKDEHGLYRFDGGAAYEYEDPIKAENVGWGASNFDLGKSEVKSFLISNALYWFREFHIDGLRVDAVANMLYLDYENEGKQWKTNEHGGRENLQAVEFIKELNTAVFKEFPNAVMIAEESTSWPMVTRPVDKGGLGFNFKWNMGWMNDMLKYIEIDPVYRKHHHNLITFSMMYAHNENFILPLSHDEVVHGKKSLIDKMWGDYWNKFAGLRAFVAYMFTHPGKKTLFMGNDFAQFIEWRYYEELEWKLIDEFEMHNKTQYFFKTLNEFYFESKALWEEDYNPEGFKWIDADNSDQSIIAFMRRTKNPKDTLIVVSNFTSTVYYNYKIGVPYAGKYEEALNTDDKAFGGSGQSIDGLLFSESGTWHKQKQFIKIKVPPMATVIFKFKN